jgi:hypothetical protein
MPLKACLYLYSSDIRYRFSNFTAARVKPFGDNWDGIRASITAVFGLVRDFGYNDSSLTYKNTLLPEVYWVIIRAPPRVLIPRPAVMVSGRPQARPPQSRRSSCAP